MRDKSLCKRLVTEAQQVFGISQASSTVYKQLPTMATILGWTAQLGSRSSLPVKHHFSPLRIIETPPLTGRSASRMSTLWPASCMPMFRAFSVSSPRVRLRSLPSGTAGPAVSATAQLSNANDVLLQSAASARVGQPQDAADPSTSSSASPHATVAGTIQRITYHSEETGYTVAKMKVSSSQGISKVTGKGRSAGLVTITGKFAEMGVGQQWTCHGTWTMHRSYGPQLIADSAEETRPASSNNLIAYLCGGATKGVGPVTATAMVEAYGDAILDVLDSKDAAAKLREVKGIGAKTAAKIKDEWEKRRGDRAMRDFLQKHGVMGAAAQRLLEQHGSLTEERVRQDPYTALSKSSPGSTFRAAEKLARALGSPSDLPGRAGSAMLHCLSQASGSNGHSYMIWDQLQKDAVKLMSSTGRPWTGTSLQNVAEDMFNSGTLLVEDVSSAPGDACHPKPDWTNQLRCYTPDMFNAEVAVANKLAGLAARGALYIPALNGVSGVDRVNNWMASHENSQAADGSPMKLSEGQRAAIMQVATSPVCVLTGGPGCGKTTTTKYIVDLWAEMGKKVALCAPTGRAAQRLTETSGRQATTIHRLLQWMPQRTDRAGLSVEAGGRFKFNARNTLRLAEEGMEEELWDRVDAVLVDEASMLGLPLAAALLEALPPQCQLVFIGDVDQLPPVGPGKVLSDVIRSGVVPGVDLREIFRQAQRSSIVRTAHAVNNGDFGAVQSSLATLNAQALQGGQYRQGVSTDAAFLAANASSMEQGIQAVLTQLVQSQGKWDTLRDVQIMSPMRKGNAGVNQLNASLQALLNPAATNKPELPFGPVSMSEDDAAASGVIRLGDRVIQTTNNYQKDVFNGDIGFVAGVRTAEREILVRYPVVARDVVYKGAELGELQLAWASTVHKAQGSECPVVILALANMHRPLLSRRLLYTALTRAKQLVVVVGSWDAVQLAVASERSEQRLSTLQQRITSLGIKHGAVADKKMIAYTSQPNPAIHASSSPGQVQHALQVAPQQQQPQQHQQQQYRQQQPQQYQQRQQNQQQQYRQQPQQRPQQYPQQQRPASPPLDPRAPSQHGRADPGGVQTYERQPVGARYMPRAARQQWRGGMLAQSKSSQATGPTDAWPSTVWPQAAASQYSDL